MDLVIYGGQGTALGASRAQNGFRKKNRQSYPQR